MGCYPLDGALGRRVRRASPEAFDQTTLRPITLHSLHLRRGRERERVEEHPLAHARGHHSTRPNRVSPHTTTRHFWLPSAMPLLSVVLTLIVVGVVLWLLHGFGVLNNAGEIHLPVVK